MEKYFLDDPFGAIWPGGEYYFTWDEDGILQINFPVTNYMAPGVTNQYHATVVCAYALSQFNMLLDTGDEQCEQVFLRYADWLVDNQADGDGLGGWQFHFRWESPGYKAIPPFISSMTQGMGISVLVRAWQLASDQRYAVAAEKALSPFEVPVARGGLLRVDREGGNWYDGTPSPIGAQILNEALFALIGLLEMQRVMGSGRAGDLFRHGLATIRRNLEDFDLDLPFFKWSRYDDALLFYSGNKYHAIQTEQLLWLSQELDDRLLARHSRKWRDWQARYGSASGLLTSKRLFALAFGRVYAKFLVYYTKHLQK